MPVADLSSAMLTPLVRNLIDDPEAEVLGFEIAPFGGGAARASVGGEGAFRVSGTARGNGETRTWSLVLKTISAKEGAGSTDPRAWNYWKREILAYQSGLLSVLPGSLAAPRCFGVVQQPQDEFWIWLELVNDSGGGVWDLDHYAQAARHLGEFNGAYYIGAYPLLDLPWLTRGRAREWLQIAEPVLSDLPEHLAARTGRHWLTAPQAERAQALWAVRGKLLDYMDRLPQSLCHHDGFRKNLFVTPGRTTAIDWQLMGIGSLGEDVAPLIAVSAQFFCWPAASIRDLEAAVFTGFLEGLREAGYQPDEKQVRFGVMASIALFAGLGTIGIWDFMADAENAPIAESIIGRPVDEIIEQWTVLQDYCLDLGQEAVLLVDLLA